jgi:hypothetical protein
MAALAEFGWLGQIAVRQAWRLAAAARPTRRSHMALAAEADDVVDPDSEAAPAQ